MVPVFSCLKKLDVFSYPAILNIPTRVSYKSLGPPWKSLLSRISTSRTNRSPQEPHQALDWHVAPSTVNATPPAFVHFQLQPDQKQISPAREIMGMGLENKCDRHVCLKIWVQPVRSKAAILLPKKVSWTMGVGALVQTKLYQTCSET